MVLYEDLAMNPKKTIQRIFQWLNREMKTQTKIFILQSTGRQRAPLFDQYISSRYFGVYRKRGGNPDGWINNLNQGEYGVLSRILSESPLMSHWPERVPE